MTETTRAKTSKRGSVEGWFRRRWLIEQVQRHGGVTTIGAARLLGVSEMTVRRDMTWLADHHGYERVHGGLLGPGR